MECSTSFQKSGEPLALQVLRPLRPLGASNESFGHLALPFCSTSIIGRPQSLNASVAHLLAAMLKLYRTDTIADKKRKTLLNRLLLLANRTHLADELSSHSPSYPSSYLLSYPLNYPPNYPSSYSLSYPKHPPNHPKHPPIHNLFFPN